MVGGKRPLPAVADAASVGASSPLPAVKRPAGTAAATSAAPASAASSSPKLKAPPKTSTHPGWPPGPLYSESAARAAVGPPPAAAPESLRILAWNVASLRSALDSSKHGGRSPIADLVSAESPDVLIVQETKINVSLEGELWRTLEAQLEGAGVPRGTYRPCWSSSGEPAAKGHAGVVALVKTTGAGEGHTAVAGLPDDVRAACGDAFGAGAATTKGEPGPADYLHAEGRVVTVRLRGASVVGVYSPNSGMKLARLGVRSAPRGWDTALRRHVEGLVASRPGRPVVLVGDLNVAPAAIDLARPTAANAKAAGFTPQERASFARLASSSAAATAGAGAEAEPGGSDDAPGAHPPPLVDAFRALHPATVAYSYWSQRAGQFGPNQGWRLDHTLVDRRCFAPADDAGAREAVSGVRVHEAFILRSRLSDADPRPSDHAPVGVTLVGPPGSLVREG